MQSQCDLQRIAVETLGASNKSAAFFCMIWVGEFRSLVSGQDRQPQFLLQRISVAIQRFFCTTVFLSSDRSPGFSVCFRL